MACIITLITSEDLAENEYNSCNPRSNEILSKYDDLLATLLDFLYRYSPGKALNRQKREGTTLMIFSILSS